MADLGNGAKTANGRPSSLTEKSSPAFKKAQLSVTHERKVQRELEVLFPRLSPVLLGELSRIYSSDFLKALDSPDSTNALKKYIYSHCKDWLKQNCDKYFGHVPESWGRIQLTSSGKFTKANLATKSSKSK
jgi:hypothetical protein